MSRTVIEHKHETRRLANQEIWTIEIEDKTKEEVNKFKEDLWEEYNLTKGSNDYIIYTPAKVRICKNYQGYTEQYEDPK